MGLQSLPKELSGGVSDGGFSLQHLRIACAWCGVAVNQLKRQLGECEGCDGMEYRRRSGGAGSKTKRLVQWQQDVRGWRTRLESNQRPSASEADTLSN